MYFISVSDHHEERLWWWMRHTVRYSDIRSEICTILWCIAKTNTFNLIQNDVYENSWNHKIFYRIRLDKRLRYVFTLDGFAILNFVYSKSVECTAERSEYLYLVLYLKWAWSNLETGSQRCQDCVWFLALATCFYLCVNIYI